tara:strand:- start:368 stop:1291 length:924 start_codon:yes stop_codon:yes gene_type:complete
MKKVIVTGGAGFIGSNLVDELINKGIEVIIIDDLSTGIEENLNDRALFYNLDISKLSPDSDQLAAIMSNLNDVDTIFHTAAKARVQPSIEDPFVYNRVNVDGTLNMLWLGKTIKINRFVYSASSSAYGNTDIFPTHEDTSTNPISPYGLQKFIGEQYCKVFSEVYGLDTVSLRYFNVYGERMLLEGAYSLVLGIFANQMLKGKKLTVNNDGRQRRDFTYVKDVVQANILAGNFKDRLGGEIFNIGNGFNFSINQVAKMFGGEVIKGKVVIEPFETLSDSSKAKKILGWRPSGDLISWIEKYKISLGI